MGFEVGKTYGDYDFLDVIRMSRTEIAYRVLNRLAQRYETLRVLPNHLQSDAQQADRFLREMRVHAKLHHPNIVAFYHAGELERCVIMTTEYMEGITLRERLALGPIPWQTAVDYMRQTLAALGSAHQQQIVHRDVTPENMILMADGRLKLAGFGLAKAASSPQLTQLGAVVGSPKYSSPEQIKGSAKIDGRSDLYSVGVVLYEAVAGRPPFSFGSQFELMLAQVSQTPDPPSLANPLVPAALDAVVLRALQKDPAQRFQTADEFSAALANVQAAIESPQTGAVAVSVEAVARPADLAPPDVAAAAVAPAPPSKPERVAAPDSAEVAVAAPEAVIEPAPIVEASSAADPVQAAPAQSSTAPAVAEAVESAPPVSPETVEASPVLAAEQSAPEPAQPPPAVPAPEDPGPQPAQEWQPALLFQDMASKPGLSWREIAIALVITAGLVGVVVVVCVVSST